MTVQQMYFQNVTQNTDAATKKSSSQTNQTGAGKEAFDSYLERADKTDAVQNAKAQKENAKPKQKTNNERPEKPVESETKPVEKEKNAEKVSETTKEEKPKTEKAEEKPTNPVEEVNKAQQDALKKLSEQLNIPVDAISQILVSMNVTPLEILGDSAKLNEFVQKLTGAKNIGEMLTMDGTKELLSKINELVPQFQEKIKQFMELNKADETGKAMFVEGLQKSLNMTVVSVKTAKAQPMVTPTQEQPVVDVDKPAEAAVVPTTQTADNTESNKGNSDDEPQNMLFSGTNQKVVAKTDTNETAINFMNVNNPVNAQAVETTTVKAEAMKNINTTDVVNQIMEKVKVEVKSDTSEIRINLKPEHLGDVTLKVITQNGIVTAQFHAESQRIKEVIEAGFNQLKDTLQQQGINISQLSVSVGQDQSNQTEQRMAQYEQGQQSIRGRRVSQISDAIMAEEAIAAQALASTDMYEGDTYDLNVDYKV